MNFVLFSALLPKARYEAKLESPSKEQLAQNFAAFSHVISSNIWNYGPVSYENLQVSAPKNVKNFKDALSQFTLSKITELAKPAISFSIPQPTEESALKKFKEKQRALEEIAVCCFMHCVFSQVFPQGFSPLGNPQKQEVRIASNLPEWRVVKKVDAAKAEAKEVFAALASMYHSLHAKYVSFSPVSLFPIQPVRKSFSTLLEMLSQVQYGNDFASEWNAFEVFNAAGFPPIPSTETIGKLYPELKIPKPRGNFGKKK